MYNVFKFGGSSIKDVANITNVSNILKSYSNDELVIIFSAMGKVTNMLEDVVELYIQKNGKPSIAEKIITNSSLL